MHRTSQIVEAFAECHTCGWTADRRNAGGLAAQHARKHRHDVVSTVTMTTNYFSESPQAERKALEDRVAVEALIAGEDPDDAIARLADAD